jgi:Protein of unknown function (DUF3667)
MMQQNESATTTVSCLNCGHVFAGAYCPACGQKHGAAMPTTKEIVGDLMRSAMSPGGKLFESLRVLLLKPGELTRVYIAGQRLRFVHPVRLYLLGIFVFAAAVNLNSKWREWNQEPPYEMAVSAVFESKSAPRDATSPKAQIAGEAVGRSMKDSLPAWMNDLIKKRAASVGNESPEQVRAKAMRAMSANYSLLFALMIPFTSLINWLLYWRRGYSYAAHFVYMLHGTAASSLILVIAYAANSPILYYPTMLVSTAWFVLAARRAFAVSLWGALWRYILMFIPAGIFSALIGIALAVVTIFFG